MSDYRVLARDAASGRLIEMRTLTGVPDDRAAIRTLTRPLPGQDLELWQQARLVAIRYAHRPAPSSRRPARRIRAWLRLLVQRGAGAGRRCRT